MRWALDLDELERRLGKSRDHRELSNSIRRHHGASSTVTDLKAALAAIKTLSEVEQLGDAGARQTIGQALAFHAVIMYVRSTSSKSNGRRQVPVTNGFSPEQMAKHRGLIELRNETFAHFGNSKGKYGEGWVEERTIVKFNSERELPFVISGVWRRANYMGEMIADLFDVCTVGLKNAQAELKARSDHLKALLDRLVDTDIELQKLMDEVHFDPATFYGSQAAIDNFWAPGDTLHEEYRQRGRDQDGNVYVGPYVRTELK